MVPTLAIIGVGLIGGSIGLAARKYKAAQRIIGLGRNRESLAKALKKKAVDEISTDISAVRQADLILICTPVETIAEYVRQLLPYAKPGALISDCGSTKEQIVREIERDLKKAKANVQFIGGHPLAGSEKTSVEYATVDLFQNRTVIITASKLSTPENTELLVNFWNTLGARVHGCTPREHDVLVAASSHVPHLISSLLAASTNETALPFVAGGWMDTTRIAAGDVELWREILTQNRQQVLKTLTRFEKLLHTARTALESEQDDKLVSILTTGKQIRDSLGS